MRKGTDMTFRLDERAPVLLEWHAEQDVLDDESVGIAAARTLESGEREFALPKAQCPQCNSIIEIRSQSSEELKRRAFTVPRTSHFAGRVSKPGAVNIAGQLITREALSMLSLVGNLAIDTSIEMYTVCASCGHAFLLAVPKRSWDMGIYEGGDRVHIWCPEGDVATFFRDGRSCMGNAPRDAGAFGEACDIGELNRVMDVSIESRHELAALFGVGDYGSDDGGHVNLLDIALHNRFSWGYDPDFFREVKEVVACDDIYPEAKSGIFLLPRRADDRDALQRVLDRSKLPNAPSVRRACAQRPVMLGLLSQSRAGRVFAGDPNLAVSFICSHGISATFTARLFDDEGKLSDLIAIAAAEEPPTVFVRKIMSMGEMSLRASVGAFSQLGMYWQDAVYAWRRARKVHSLEDVLDNPCLLEDYMPEERDGRIAYSDKQLELQGALDGFEFFLPMTIDDFKRAGDELKNCLAHGYGLAAAIGEKLIVLVGENKKLVAAIELSPRTFEMLQAFGKANRIISSDERLWRAVEKWCRSHGIESAPGMRYEPVEIPFL